MLLFCFLSTALIFLGMLDNILSSRLYRAGSVAYVSRSGGMSNELNNIISINTDGVYEGVAIGGDRYCSVLLCYYVLAHTSFCQNLICKNHLVVMI